jgi:hypothetical protein
MLGAMLGAIQTPMNFDRRDARRDQTASIGAIQMRSRATGNH